MVLKKTIAAKIVNGVITEPQKDIEMHPLEQRCIMAYWSLNDIMRQAESPKSVAEEFEMLVQNGVDSLIAARDAQKEKNLQLKALAKSKELELSDAELKWEEHCKACIDNGYDQNTHDRDKYL